MRPSSTSSLLLLAAVGLVSACQGPAEERDPLRLRIEPSLMTRDWADGPRAESVDMKIRAESKRFVRSLFRHEAMPDGAPGEDADESGERLVALAKGLRPPGRTPPAWHDGVPEPPRAEDHDLPRPWPVEIRQGENMRIVAKWAGSTPEAIREENRETLGRRKWLRVGDRLTLTMSANQKYAFDQAREQHQQDRISNYFATRYVDKVVVYRVKRGDSILAAAKQYGEVPVWLLGEFNQRDFRRLRPREEILIPVIKHYASDDGLPPPLQVVDEEGQPLTGEKLSQVEGRLRDDLLGRARMAVDDSNVFERGDDPHVRRSRTLLPSVGQLTGSVAPTPPSVHQLPSAPRPEVALPEPKAEPVKTRQVIVKKRETLGHYAAWSGLSTSRIVSANPGLNPDRIFIGKKIKLPLTDAQYADFVTKRAEAFLSPKERAERARARRLAEQQARQQAATAAQGQPQSPTPQRPVAAIGHQPQPAPPAPKPKPDRYASIGIRPAAIPTPGARRASRAVRPAPKPNPAPAPAPAPSAADEFYVVAPGDIAARIAKQHGMSLNELRKLNPDADLELIRVGDKLRIE